MAGVAVAMVSFLFDAGAPHDSASALLGDRRGSGFDGVAGRVVWGGACFRLAQPSGRMSHGC